jgi:hypothetical protein
MSNFSGQLDSVTVDIPCPNPNKCGHKIAAKIGQLKRNPKLRCSKCKFEFSVDARQFRNTLDNLTRKLKF